MKKDDKESLIIMIIVMAIVISWFGLLIAPYLDGGLPKILKYMPEITSHPFSIKLCKDSLKAVLVLLMIYGITLGVYLSDRKNYRRKEEHGSAKWGDAHTINKKYEQKPITANKIITQNMYVGLDAKRHFSNLNTVIIGGSGTGKTRYYGKPNLMQCNTSFVILDPKGEMISDVGNLLEREHYVIEILDLLNMEKSHCYNPFAYIRNQNDVQKLVTNLFKSTTPKGAQSTDPFWDTAAINLLSALIYYLHYFAPPEEQNFSMVLEMIRAGTVDEDDDTIPSPLDELFYDLEAEFPDHIAVKSYKGYRLGAAKTLKSIQITLTSRLEKFNIDLVAKLTNCDELELDKLGDRKTALFAIIPDDDSSFNFLVSILYTQIFQQLYEVSYRRPNKRLKIPVHFLMDEFANVSLPNDFDKILSTMRSRGVFVSIILQSLAQIKALFEKEWEGILGNCDQLLYLGGNEKSTHQYLSEAFGKETIDTNTYGRTYGGHGNYSTNFQQAARELMTSDEVRMLDKRHAVVLYNGERPVIDLKYDIKKHPNIKYTADGDGGIYEYGKDTLSKVSIEILDIDPDLIPYINIENSNYELYSKEDLEEMFIEENGGINNEIKKKRW